MLGVSKAELDSSENLIFIVTGGFGRNICSTAVVRNLKSSYPDKKIIVICSLPELFLKNPNVYKVFNLSQTQYLYEDYLLNEKSVIINAEPYQHPEYFYKKSHFTKVWCDILEIPCDSIYPEVFFSDMEIALAENYVKGFTRPLVLCQFEGGKIPPDKSQKERLISKAGMYRRTLSQECQQEIIDGLIKRDFKPAVVAHENQFLPIQAEKIYFPIRAILALIPHVKHVICIDSFLMHGTAIFKKPSIACWAGTSPIVLGYPFNINLRTKVCPTPECHRPNSYMFDVEASGFPWECGHNDSCTKFDSKRVLEEFDKFLIGDKDNGRKDSSGAVEGIDFGVIGNGSKVLASPGLVN